jgi:hypothetical protein
MFRARTLSLSNFARRLHQRYLEKADRSQNIVPVALPGEQQCSLLLHASPFRVALVTT